MKITVRIAGFSKDVGIQRVHEDESTVLKFVAIKDGGEIRIIMGFASQHRALVLLHVFGYDMEKMKACILGIPTRFTVAHHARQSLHLETGRSGCAFAFCGNEMCVIERYLSRK